MIADCQKLMYDEGDYSFYSLIGNDYWDIVNLRDEYPERINDIVDTILAKWMGVDVVNLKFSTGIIGRLDEYYKENPDAIFEKSRVIPSYVYVFNWSDTTLGIGKYNLIIRLDNYGHLIDMNFPQIIYLSDKNFLSLDRAKELGDSLANISIPNYKDFYVNFEYDDCENDLFWTLFYSDSNDKAGGETYFYSFSLITGQQSYIKSGIEISDGQEIMLIKEVEFEPEEIRLEDN